MKGSSHQLQQLGRSAIPTDTRGAADRLGPYSEHPTGPDDGWNQPQYAASDVRPPLAHDTVVNPDT